MIAGDDQPTTNAETCCALQHAQAEPELFFHEQDPEVHGLLRAGPATTRSSAPSRTRRTRRSRWSRTSSAGARPVTCGTTRPSRARPAARARAWRARRSTRTRCTSSKADGTALYVNLYSPSTLNWAEKGVTVTQETRLPGRAADHDAERRRQRPVRPQAAGAVLGAARVPVTVNGVRQPVTRRPATYVTIVASGAPATRSRLDAVQPARGAGARRPVHAEPLLRSGPARAVQPRDHVPRHHPLPRPAARR